MSCRGDRPAQGRQEAPTSSSPRNSIPDRYFRKEIGDYGDAPRPHLQEGPRGPRNPLGSRSSVRSRTTRPRPTAAESGSGRGRSGSTRRPCRRAARHPRRPPPSAPAEPRTLARSSLSKLERLKPAHALQDQPRRDRRTARRGRTRSSGRRRSPSRAGDSSEAEANIRIAISFDPGARRVQGSPRQPAHRRRRRARRRSCSQKPSDRMSHGRALRGAAPARGRAALSPARSRS